MSVYFLFLIIGLVVPVDLEKYNVVIIPVPYTVSKKSVEVYLLPQPSLRHRVLVPEHAPVRHRFARLDIEQLDEPTEGPDIDHFDTISELTDRDENLNPYYRSQGGYGMIEENLALDNGIDDDESNTVDQDDRIVGGAEVDINMYPYHVGYGSNCGGAIIGSKWVLTAGHCGKKAYIRTGSKYLNQGKRTEVKAHNIHPNWSARKKEHPFDYDFQVLELKDELKFDENTQPIKVAHIEDMVIGKMVTVTGWGNTEENGPYSTVLRAVTVPIIAKDNCQKVPFAYFRGGLTARMFCAGYREGKKDACQGDSGGPAVAYDRLLGMVSFGYGCATPGSYGVYSKVAKVRDWIQAVTGLRLD